MKNRGMFAAALVLATAIISRTSVMAVPVDDDQARILGGGPVSEGELKYQLSMRLLGTSHVCGASLTKVDNLQIGITAAHCVMRRLPEQLTLVAGNLLRGNSSLPEQHRQERQVVDFVIHENFDLRLGPAHDIAILFLDKPFTENEYVGVIPLPRQSQGTQGRVILSGWGLHKTKIDQNDFGLLPSETLNKVEVPVLDFATCKQSYSQLLLEFSDHFMCTGFKEDWSTLYKGSCIGDSGGPVKAAEGYLAGIISFGKGCKDTNYPAVNMRVSHFVDWINDEVRKYKYGGSSEEESREEERESNLASGQTNSLK